MTKDAGKPEKTPRPGDGPPEPQAAGPRAAGPPGTRAGRPSEAHANGPSGAHADAPADALAGPSAEQHTGPPADAHAADPAEKHSTPPSDELILTLLIAAGVVGAAVGAWALGPVARWLLDVLPVAPFRFALRFLGAIDAWWEMLLAGAGGAVVLLVVTLGALEKRGIG
ncbi:hypothetical protein [Streptomyces sp. SID11385]|uniref:YqeB family protein n=1 Tax=Streptomyces sp. SID11385 TaxID=2706031 RepID=UPI001EF3BF80|nr:hypothetical protein [Streptomyces sp. SID11385]